MVIDERVRAAVLSSVVTFLGQDRQTGEVTSYLDQEMEKSPCGFVHTLQLEREYQFIDRESNVPRILSARQGRRRLVQLLLTDAAGVCFF